jgi:hypothetical protein
VLKVDTSVGPGDEPDASTGRFSVRITSRQTYNGGLFLFDVKHSPFGCGTWPALWLVDPYSWPDHGEIDVMEATNQGDAGNQMTLHTTSGCSMGVRRKQTGHAEDANCDHDANNNAGCGVKGGTDSFGDAFNRDGGGVMALEWRDEGMRMWQFARDAIPSDIASKQPNPATWGTAAADFPNTDCNIGSHFRNNSIVANINLCGELVEAVYGDSGCKLDRLPLPLPLPHPSRHVKTCNANILRPRRPQQLHRLCRQQPGCVWQCFLGVWRL